MRLSVVGLTRACCQVPKVVPLYSGGNDSSGQGEAAACASSRFARLDAACAPAGPFGERRRWFYQRGAGSAAPAGSVAGIGQDPVFDLGSVLYNAKLQPQVRARALH